MPQELTRTIALVATGALAASAAIALAGRLDGPAPPVAAAHGPTEAVPADAGAADLAAGPSGGTAGAEPGTAPAEPSPDGPSPAGGEPSCEVFPVDNPWNTEVADLPVHERSDEWVASVGVDGNLHPDLGTVWDGEPIGIPYALVGADQPRVPVSFTWADESDPGPYPIPPDVPVEGGDDSHVIVVDDDACVLYELFAASSPDGGSSWEAGSGAVFDLSSNELRPDTWTSADAAGLPIFAGLVRYDEVVSGEIDHALRFTASSTQQAFVHPATHFASDITDPSVPPMGVRYRLRSDFDCASMSFEAGVICTALQRYGMFLADNGSDWFLSGAHDLRWDDEALGDLKDIPGSAFEVVDTGEPVRTGG